MTEIKDKTEVLDNILFEIIVLLSGVPLDDVRESLATICVLSELPTDVTQHLVLTGERFHKEERMDDWKQVYAEALVMNDKYELAEELNAHAKNIMG